MSASLLVATVIAAAPVADVPTDLWQTAPDAGAKSWVAPAQPSAKARAVVLIPGLYVHPLRPVRATRPEMRAWQMPGAELVKALAKDSDVFAFGYAQTLSVDEVAQAPGLLDAVTRLRAAGYTEVVLVGHSAGGVIARQFLEANPNAGATKVVAVAAPFAGAEAATLNVGYPKAQAPFVKSLAPDARTAATRANKLALAKDAEFACVVCKLKRVDTDGVVQTRSQWPDDLQCAGVPAVLSSVSHANAMDSAATAKTIAELATKKLARWSSAEVETARAVLFGESITRPGLFRREK